MLSLTLTDPVVVVGPELVFALFKEMEGVEDPLKVLPYEGPVVFAGGEAQPPHQAVPFLVIVQFLFAPFRLDQLVECVKVQGLLLYHGDLEGLALQFPKLGNLVQEV